MSTDPIGNHLQVKFTQKNIFKVTTAYVNGSTAETCCSSAQ
jgi:hypothetical protein